MSDTDGWDDWPAVPHTDPRRWRWGVNAARAAMKPQPQWPGTSNCTAHIFDSPEFDFLVIDDSGRIENRADGVRLKDVFETLVGIPYRKIEDRADGGVDILL